MHLKNIKNQPTETHAQTSVYLHFILSRLIILKFMQKNIYGK